MKFRFKNMLLIIIENKCLIRYFYLQKEYFLTPKHENC